MEEKKIEKLLNSAKNTMFIFLIISIISIVVIGFAVYKMDLEKNMECKDYSKITGTSEDQENVYVKLNIVDYAAFAEKDDVTYKYCFVIDEEGVWYIAKLSKSTMDKLDREIESNSKTFSFELKGCTAKIPTEVKPLAIETVNEWYEDEEDFVKISLINFDSVFGKYCIDEGETPNSGMYSAFIGIFAVVLIVSGGAFIGFAISRSFEKKIIKNIGVEELKEELRDSSVLSFDKQKLYLTRNYIISGNGKFNALRYEDVVWTYIMNQRTNGIETGIFLIIKNIKGKTYTIGHSTKNAKENLELAIQEIMKKNKNALVGYTTENMKMYNQMVKDNK